MTISRAPVPASALVAALRQAVAARPAIAAAYLYGSAARDRTTPLSDVDVALLFRPGRPAVLNAYPELGA